ncbi:hypothetical protein OsJ_04292 [Oryza sativa Japonica Group]|uniref:Pectinesterase catalytic domain-containing protein n=1 Tax=Oryza sativa subsp. japonica TaxID=39947 RepID=A3A075_ORYSJ|nr:hypothetical protein OsJ_04292 [Oryza sativa Japonica Group]
MALYREKPDVHHVYLGRPWKEYSRTVYVGCTLSEIVQPPRWMAWNGDFALKTLYYGEYESAGPGGRRPQGNQDRVATTRCPGDQLHVLKRPPTTALFTAPYADVRNRPYDPTSRSTEPRPTNFGVVLCASAYPLRKCTGQRMRRDAPVNVK